jgi:hypothetical protein
VPMKLAAITCRIDCVSPSCCPPILSMISPFPSL